MSLLHPEFPKIETLYTRFKDGPQKGKVNVAEIHCPEFTAVRHWRVTEKVDGMNIRCCYIPQTQDLHFEGRTDAAQLPGDLLRVLKAMFPADKMAKAFPAEPSSTDAFEQSITLYGEGYGAGIQSAGKHYRPDKSFRLFDVKIGRWWLRWRDVCDIAANLGIQTVPCGEPVDLNPADIKNPLEWLASELPNSKVAESDSGNFVEAEGVVVTSDPLLLMRDGRPLRWKLKAKDF